MMDGFADLPVVKHTFDEASDALSVDLWAMLQADSADEINATVNTQPIMLAAGYATYLAWQELNGRQPSLVAGHSLGEYTALVAAAACRSRKRSTGALARGSDASRGAGRHRRDGGHSESVR